MNLIAYVKSESVYELLGHRMIDGQNAKSGDKDRILITIIINYN